LNSDKDTKNVITTLFNDMTSAYHFHPEFIPDEGARWSQRLHVLQKAGAAMSAHDESVHEIVTCVQKWHF